MFSQGRGADVPAFCKLAQVAVSRYVFSLSGRKAGLADLKRKLVTMLKAGGCHYVRPAKGDHEWWYSPITKQHFPVDHSIKSFHTANGILKQAGLPKAF